LNDGFRSKFLFALSSWQEGVGRLVDFGDSLTESSATLAPGDADARAIAQDFLAVGKELQVALWRYILTHESKE
jgi:hypothetical protein